MRVDEVGEPDTAGSLRQILRDLGPRAKGTSRRLQRRLRIAAELERERPQVGGARLVLG
jgi:hypothetical protein